MSYMVGGLKVQEILEAVVYHHAHGHIHRDVKARNILVDSNGATKLADVGVFAHPCLILGIGNTQEILLLELLTGATLKKVVVYDISIFYSQKVPRPSYMRAGNRVNRRIIRTLEFYHEIMFQVLLSTLEAGVEDFPLQCSNKKTIESEGRSEVQMTYAWKSWN